MDLVTFAEPRALWALGLALPLVALHLYRKRRRRVVVAFVPLVRESLGPVRPLGGWRRVFGIAPLLCRVAALGALALALAGPRPVDAAPRPVDLVIVLDADVTTTTIERGDPRDGVGRTRFAAAQELARAVRRAHTNGNVGLVVAGASPVAALAPGDDPAAFDHAVAGAAPAPGTVDLGAAIAVARGAATTGRDLEVRVITSRALPVGTEDVTAVGAGSASDDQGLVDVAAAPTADGKGFTVRLSVRNADGTAHARTLRLAWRGEATALLERSLELAAHGRVDVSHDVTAPRGGAVLVATLVGADVFAGNDVAALVLTPPARPSVLVIHAGRPRPFLTAVLEALGDAVDREASGIAGVIAAAQASPRDVTIVDGVALPPAARPTGPTIYLAPFDGGGGTMGALPFTPGATLAEPLVWRAEAAHPLLRGVDLSTAYVARGTTITGEGIVGLAFVEGAAVVAEGGSGTTRFVAFGLDPEGSDLPLRAAFPVLLRNAIRRLAVAPATPLPPFVRAGEPLRPRHPLAGAGHVTIELESLAAPSPSASSAGRGAARDAARVAPGSPFQLDRFAPDGDVPIAPAGGPWLVTVMGPVEPGAEPSAAGERRVLARTVILDLDPTRDVAPVRAAIPPPPPAPPPPETIAARWLRALLVAAGVLLVLDLLLTRAGMRKKVAYPSIVS